MKNKRIGAAAAMDPPLTHSKKKNGKQREKSTNREKRGLEPTDPEFYCCCDSTLLKCAHEPTHPPKKRTKENKNRKKSKKNRQERVRTRSSGILLL